MRMNGFEVGVPHIYVAGLRVDKETCDLLAGVIPHGEHALIAPYESAVVANGKPVDITRPDSREFVSAMQSALDAKKMSSRLLELVVDTSSNSTMVQSALLKDVTPGMRRREQAVAILGRMERVIRRPDILAIR